MSGFTNNGMEEMKQPCKVDLQNVAARQKERLDTFNDFRQSLKKFIGGVEQYQIDQLKIHSIAELLGYLEMAVVKYLDDYDRTLIQIENEK